jgi:hypothetical protein
MADLFKSYGAAIGPAVAFMLGLLTLFIKDAIERRTVRRNIRNRLRNLLEMMRSSPPPPFQGPIDALSNTKYMLTNAANMLAFYDRIAAIDGAMIAADKIVHEHAPSATIMLFHRMKFHLGIILRERNQFHKVARGTNIPGEDNFFNVHASWKGFVQCDTSARSPLLYDTVPEADVS